MKKAVELPIIDLASPDRVSTATSIRQACLDCGFFYLINHGIEDELLKTTFDEIKKFFLLPLEEKTKLSRNKQRGYTPLYAEKLNLDSSSRGDCKESFYVGPPGDIFSDRHVNQWPSEELLPSWRPTMECYYESVLDIGKRLVSLLSLALNLDEDFFVKVGAFNPPMPMLRLLHYPGDMSASGEEIIGSSAHSDYGMMTLLATDGVAGLQLCRDKSKSPLIWEDVEHIDGSCIFRVWNYIVSRRAFVVNIGDMLERWTNCMFRSTLHRVMPVGQERYSMAFFLNPNPDCIVECLKSCCSESNPPRFPAIRSGEYLQERLRITHNNI